MGRGIVDVSGFLTVEEMLHGVVEYLAGDIAQDFVGHPVLGVAFLLFVFPLVVVSDCWI